MTRRGILVYHIAHSPENVQYGIYQPVGAAIKRSVARLAPGVHMSHFSLHVLIPRLKTPAPEDLRPPMVRLRAEIEPLLAPFSEAIDVTPYSSPCSCVGRAARTAAQAEAETAVGTLDQLRTQFAAR